VGFGIKTRAHVQAVEAFADAIAIGSAIIATLEAAPGGERAARVRAYVEDVTGR
jgi:tryptophan synthase